MKMIKWQENFYTYESKLWHTDEFDSLMNKANKCVPMEGSSEYPMIERWRMAQNLWYDIYNNGGSNATQDDGMLGRFGVKPSRARHLRANLDQLEERTLKALLDAIKFAEENSISGHQKNLYSD